MLMVVCFALGAATVPLTGGRLGLLANVRLVGGWALFSALGVQIVVVSIAPGMPDPVAAVLHVVSYALAAAFLWVNRRIAGLWLVAAGAASNFVVIAANGGVMPASAAALDRAGQVTSHGDFENSVALVDAKLGFLGDVFAVPASWPFANVFSLGDVLIVAGAIAVLHATCDSRVGRLLGSAWVASGPQPGAAGRDASRTAAVCETRDAVSRR